MRCTAAGLCALVLSAAAGCSSFVDRKTKGDPVGAVSLNQLIDDQARFAATRPTRGGGSVTVLHSRQTERVARRVLERLARVYAETARLLGGDPRFGVRLYLLAVKKEPGSYSYESRRKFSADRFIDLPALLVDPARPFDPAANPDLNRTLYSRVPRQLARGAVRELVLADPATDWFTRGLAGYAEHHVARELARRVWSAMLVRRMPRVSLDDPSTRGAIFYWTPAVAAEEERRLGAAMALFLEIERLGGPRAIPEILGKLTARDSRAGTVDLKGIVKATLGRSIHEIGRLDHAAEQSLLAEAIRALTDDDANRRRWGMRVIEFIGVRYAPSLLTFEAEGLFWLEVMSAGDGTTAERSRLLLHLRKRFREAAAPLGRLVAGGGLEDRALAARALAAIRAADALAAVLVVASRADQLAESGPPLIRSLGNFRDAKVVNLLIGLLKSEQALVRRAAVRSLREITLRSFNYHPDDPVESRRRAIKRWQAWFDSNSFR